MKKLNNHNASKFEVNSNIFLDKKMQEAHKKDLGLSVSNDYFSKSKIAILEEISKKKSRKKLLIFSKERIVWSVAASIALVFALTIFKPNTLPSIDEIPSIVSDTIDQIKNNGLAYEYSQLKENDILMASLFVEDTEIDEFVNNYVLEELVFKEVLSN